MMKVDICIFAHNEERAIGSMMADLARQSWMADHRFDVRIVVAVNGSSDGTAVAARAAINGFPRPEAVAVVELAEGGKSRTWNKFVHEFARPDAETLVLRDADIALPQEQALSNLCQLLQERSDLQAVSSMREELEVAARDPRWLGRVLKQYLPNREFGWVPKAFLMSRFNNFLRHGKRTSKAIITACLAFGFDLLVYPNAQWRMARGTGAGFW